MTMINPIRPELGQGLPLGDTSSQTLKIEPGAPDNVFASMINDVNQLQAQAGAAEKNLYTGDTTELHRVMIAAEEAGTAFELLVEMRNRVVEAYQELMRMQI